MNGTSPEDWNIPAGRPASCSSRQEPHGARTGDSPSEHRAGPENTLEANPSAGEDEILRSGRAREAGRSKGRATPIAEPAATRADRERRIPGPTDERYAGWLPTDQGFTVREIVVAAFVAGALSAVVRVVLAVVERWIVIPAPVGGNEIPLALSVGLLCGLYVLLRLRARRLLWRRQLTGEGP